MKKKCCLSFVGLLAVQICVCACVSVRGAAPYFASGEFAFRQERLFVDYVFLNESPRTVEKVDFVVCVEDSEEEYFFARKFFASCKISVPPGESVEDYFEVQDFFDLFDRDDFNGTDLQIESFYAEKIYYSDGTFFEDPFGRYAK